MRAWMRNLRCIGTAAAFGLGGHAAAAQLFIDVGGNDLAFSPALLSATVGDTVTFVNRGGFHNVAADDGSFRCAQGCDGSGGDGNPSDAAWTADVVLSAAGTVGYHCEVHGAPGLGMHGSIEVVPLPPPPPPAAGIDAAPGPGAPALLLLALGLAIGAALRRRALRGLR
jgi:plastocyanin